MKKGNISTVSIGQGQNHEDQQEQAEAMQFHEYLINCHLNMNIHAAGEALRKDMDLKLARLSQNLEKKIAKLDLVNRRIKDVAILATQHRILRQREKELDEVEAACKSSDVDQVLANLSDKQNVYCDRLETSNVDFGYDEKGGFDRLDGAVEDAIGLLNELCEKGLDQSDAEYLEEIKNKLEERKKFEVDIDKNTKGIVDGLPELSRLTVDFSSEKLSNMK